MKNLLEELIERFNSFRELRDPEEFSLGFTEYLLFIDETTPLNSVARKIFNNKPSPIFPLYRAVKRAGQEPGKKIWLELMLEIDSIRPFIGVFHREMLVGVSSQCREDFYEGFDSEYGILQFANKEILIAKKEGVENSQVRLLSTLIKDIARWWSTDEILEDWEGIDARLQDFSKNIFYDAAYKLNKTVAVKTGITDFLEYTTKKYRINPLYLKDK